MIHDDYGNRRFYGIYRGTVVDNNDPLNQVRLKVKVPQILFDQVTDWAWSVQQPGVIRSTPKIGDGVWVSFEGGDPSYPVWTGSFKAAPYNMQAGTTTGGSVTVTFDIPFSSGTTPIVTASVLSTNDKPEIFVLNSVTNTGFTGQVWSSSGTVSPYNNFVAANGRTIHWTAVQLTP